VTAIPGIVLSGGIDGHLRAYSSKTGAIVWDVDTKQQYNTVNGVSGQSGSLGGVQSGSAVDADIIYVTVSNVMVEVVPK
jgi:polyvinyl alcohol dehydrogenase (cytochrome)